MVMASPLSLLVKHKIISKHQSGQSLNSISQEMGVSYAAVWTLWHRFSSEGKSGLLPRYDHNGRKGPGRDCLVFRAACWLKRLHPDWGAVVIHTVLGERYGGEGLASARQMNRWFRAVGLSKRGGKAPRNPKQWAREVHDVWQMDAKERFKLDTGEEFCWLTVVDEKSGALIAAPPFPPRNDLAGAPGGFQAGIGGAVQGTGASEGHQG
jgi:transposase